MTSYSKWDEEMMRFPDRSMSANAYLNSLDKNFEDFRHHDASTLSEYSARGIRNIVRRQYHAKSNAFTIG